MTFREQFGESNSLFAMAGANQHAHVRRCLPIVACILVFLFAFHAKTAVYGEGLKAKPHTNTASKLCVTDKALAQRPESHRFLSFIVRTNPVDPETPVFGRTSLRSQVSSGFVPVLCFSGLSPPHTAQETK
jgi:hypothetical protein